MRLRRAPAWAALLALAACASSGSTDDAWRSMSVNQIRIDVMNNNFSDVTVWLVVRDARRERLGTVTGKTEETYLVPWDFSQPLRLELDVLAGPRCMTRAIDVDPGDTLQLEIMAVFRETTWCVGS
jgi:uncharacterized lipoprotein YajG